MFLRLRLRFSLENTAELLNPDSFTQTGTKTGGGGVVSCNEGPMVRKRHEREVLQAHSHHENES